MRTNSSTHSALRECISFRMNRLVIHIREMLRVGSLYRPAGVMFLVSLLATGCGETSSTPADAGLAGHDAVDGPKPTQPDAGPVYLADAGEAPDGASSIGEAGAAISPVDGGSDVGKQPPSTATIVVLPDTQYYAKDYPAVFMEQTDWIVAQKLAMNIAAVLHVGDIVDSDLTIQWTAANPAMRELDKVALPYIVVPGNHDYSTVDRKSMFMETYFAPSSMPWITGTMTPDKIDNSYMLVDIGPQKWLVLGLEFAPRDSVLDWANTVLKTYAQYPAIIVTHLYLYSDGTRYDINVGGNDQSSPAYQWWNPQQYQFTASEGINDGEAMWQKLVLPNSNVRLVFCGHMTGWARLTSTRPDGTTVHQILSDYQWLNGENFGYGYLRVVQLDYGKKAIQVQTFSPYLNDFLTDDPNQFTLPLNL